MRKTCFRYCRDSRSKFCSYLVSCRAKHWIKYRHRIITYELNKGKYLNSMRRRRFQHTFMCFSIAKIIHSFIRDRSIEYARIPKRIVNATRSPAEMHDAYSCPFFRYVEWEVESTRREQCRIVPNSVAETRDTISALHFSIRWAILRLPLFRSEKFTSRLFHFNITREASNKIILSTVVCDVQCHHRCPPTSTNVCPRIGQFFIEPSCVLSIFVFPRG